MSENERAGTSGLDTRPQSKLINLGLGSRPTIEHEGCFLIYPCALLIPNLANNWVDWQQFIGAQNS
jgi:hypothetical protein